MHTHRIGVFGASGYAGMELTRLLAAHPALKVHFLASERHVGTSVSELTGVEGPLGRTQYVGFDAARSAARECAAVLLATPAEVSLNLAIELVAAGVKIVDLSGALRLADAAVFMQAYGHAAPPSDLQARAVYGLTELARDQVRAASVVANPGCYPTAATLPLVPLLRAGLIGANDLVVDALSGASGAGRKGSEDFSLVELHDNVRAYKVLGHQHTPEIAQTLSRAAGTAVDVTFTPHLLPISRGILCTTYARLTQRADRQTLLETLRAAYPGEAFIRVLETPEAVSLHKVVGTNVCAMSLTCDPRAGGRVVLVSAIDNLVKGAAGQALQNLNLMLGLEETSGLTAARRFYP